MADRTSTATGTADDAGRPTDTMDALARLSELFSDRPVGELAIVLDKHNNDVKSAAWALLNGERADDAAAAALPQDQQQPGPTSKPGSSESRHDNDDDDDDVNATAENLLVGWDVVDGDSPVRPLRSAPEEIQRLYEEGTITEEEYHTMVSADRRAAEHRESRQHSGAIIGDNDNEFLSASGRRPSSLKVTKRLQGLADRLQKLNLPALIDQMERDQETADHLDQINRENKEHAEAKEMVREAERLSIEIMQEHLEEFLRDNPRASYESWISALHPDNVVEGKLLEGVGSTDIDHRFFVADSDHRRLWNESIAQRHDGDRRNYVSARTSKTVKQQQQKADGQVVHSRGDADGGGNAVVRDLLGSGSIIKTAASAATEAPPNGTTDDINLLTMDSLEEEGEG